MDAITTGPRVRAPDLHVSGGWLNTTAPLHLADLRGRFVLLDFWTFCCGNCLHVIEELRSLEREHAGILTVVGIHSPKFPHEAHPAALAAAIERYGVHHPVANDPGLDLWRQYAVKAWPTLVLIDPEGYVVAQAAGEGQVSALGAIVDELAATHTTRGTLRRGGSPYDPPAPESSTLRFPAKAVMLPSERSGRGEDTLLIADAGHHQLVETALDAETVLRRIGSGVRGRGTDEFSEPNGLTLLPPDAPYDVLVADTANHLLRGVRLADGAIMATVDLAQAVAELHTITGAVPGVPSPWDVVWWPALRRAVIAAAGVHLLLALDPWTAQVDLLAGTTVEGLRDGRADEAWLAQPSGLAVDGDRLWFVDSESSALRYLTLDAVVHTVVGEGLFDFGHVDGPAGRARFQHPLGVAVLRDGSVAVLDTYNGAVRRYDPITDTVSTLARDLAEPSGALLVGDDLVVVESAAHHLVRPVPTAQIVDGTALRSERPPIEIAPGMRVLEVVFTPPPGRTLDDRFGPSTRLTVSASPPELLVSGAGDTGELRRELELSPTITQGVLHINAQAATCDDDPAHEHPACYLARQDWGIPVQITPHGRGEIRLVLLG